MCVCWRWWLSFKCVACWVPGHQQLSIFFLTVFFSCQSHHAPVSIWRHRSPVLCVAVAFCVVVHAETSVRPVSDPSSGCPLFVTLQHNPAHWVQVSCPSVRLQVRFSTALRHTRPSCAYTHHIFQSTAAHTTNLPRSHTCLRVQRGSGTVSLCKHVAVAIPGCIDCVISIYTPSWCHHLPASIRCHCLHHVERHPQPLTVVTTS